MKAERDKRLLGTGTVTTGNGWLTVVLSESTSHRGDFSMLNVMITHPNVGDGGFYLYNYLYYMDGCSYAIIGNIGDFI